MLMKVIIYWHDIFLPYSEYLIRAFEDHPEIEYLVIAGPPVATSEAIFSAGKHSVCPFEKATFRTLETYQTRPKWVKLTALRQVIRHEQPDLIIVMDEALSVNVFNAGMANWLEGNKAKVLFYGFENLNQSIPLKYLKENFGIKAVKDFFRKTFRYLVFDIALHPLRKRLVHGGLYCYQECKKIIHQFGWYPPMREQWWGIQLDQFFAAIPAKAVIKARSEIGIPESVKVIGFVGRFIEDKGVLDLLQVLTLSSNLHLLAIGAGPLQEQIEAQAEKWGIRGRLHVLPPKTQQELAVLYRAMDVLVLPSRTGWFWKEQYGRVLVEAMACGVPVVGSNSGAIPYVVGDPRCIHEERNPASILAALNYSLSKPKADVKTLQARAAQGEASRFVSAFISMGREICRI